MAEAGIKVATGITTAGIDVGGERKGFHAVAMRGQEVVDTISSCDPVAIVEWCRKNGATVVAVDAPISWSNTGRARTAERALMRQGIWCFSTPTEKAAKVHPTNHFGWMLQGAKLYRTLEKSFAHFNGSNERVRPICFETFPHAIACALNGTPVSARNKRTVRRALLARAGIDCDALINIDLVDAALCALSASQFAQGRFDKHGDTGEGFIVLPQRAISHD